MKRIVNKGRRRLGIPGRPAIILGPGESLELTPDQLGTVYQNKTAQRWIEYGVLEIVDSDKAPAKPKTVKPKKRILPAEARRVVPDESKPEPPPEGVEGEGVEMIHKGGGWWQVYVNGFQVTDRNVRKDEAEAIASEYSDGPDT
jgi:hypothetical protein